MRVYAAGPMTGLTYEQAHEWRKELADRLSPFVHVLAPTRVKVDLYPKHHDGETNPLITNRGLTRRDRFDVQRSDAVVFNALGMKHDTFYIGTTIEIGWATAYDKPTILIAEPGGPYHHAMVNDLIDYQVRSIEEAAHVVRVLFDA